MEQPEIAELMEAVNDVIESAQGGKYGEIICDADDFAALEEIMDRVTNGETLQKQM